MKLLEKSKVSLNQAGELGQAKLGKVNVSESPPEASLQEVIENLVDTMMNWTVLGPGFHLYPGANTEGPGVEEAPAPSVSPSCGTWEPRWGPPKRMAVSRP